MIREKRLVRSTWPASTRKSRRGGPVGQDDSEKDSNDTSDDGNSGAYKKFFMSCIKK